MPMPEQPKDKKERLGELICKKLDMTPDLLPHGHRVDIRGGGTVTVSGCGNILLYTKNEIRVSLFDAELSVIGEDLLCVAYSAGEVVIEGKIKTVSFEEAKK